MSKEEKAVGGNERITALLNLSLLKNLSLSLLKNLSSLLKKTIRSGNRFADEGRNGNFGGSCDLGAMRGFSASLQPSNSVVKTNGLPCRSRSTCSVATISSRGATFVAMMQTTNLREHNNLACRGRLYAARLWTILV